MALNLTLAPPADTWLWWPLVIAPLFVALCTFVGGLGWAVAVATSRWSRSFIDQVIVKIALNWLDDAIAVTPAKKIPGDVHLYCLVIRFGTDAYLATMASEQERRQGRLINGVIEIGANMILNLPVHRKLGTQFKLYYLFPKKGQAGTLWQALKAAQAKLASHHAVHQIVLDENKPAGRKCWFTLAAYGAQKTVDNFGGSYFAATQVVGFERRNRLKQWWWWMRKDQPE